MDFLRTKIKKRKSKVCFEFVCSDPMGSDRNHPVLHLLHLGQHSLRAVEDLILMCG